MFLEGSRQNQRECVPNMNYNISILLSCIVVILSYSVYLLVNWIWLRPKRIEKCLREQGFSGNPYRLLKGDQEEMSHLMQEAWSKPINLTDDITKRVVPEILQTIKKHGVKNFMWVGRTPRVHISEPELVREALLKWTKFHRNLHAYDPITRLFFQTAVATLEGEQWSQRRRLLGTFFQYDKVRQLLPEFYVSCRNMVNKWETKASKTGSVEIDAHHDLETLTGDMIARTFFGSSFEECTDIFELLKELQVLTIQVIRSVYIPGWRFLPTKRNRQMRKVDKKVADLVREIINKKIKAIKAGETTSDILCSLLQATMSSQTEKDKNKKIDQIISIPEIISECRLFYFAGQDTTSTLLTWSMVLLSIHPEWQTLAREEVKDVFPNNEPDYEGISHLKIVMMILYEVLRLYPPAIEITKVTVEDTKLGELTIPAGAQLMLPAMLLQRDPELWGDDAHEFNPGRFSEGLMKGTKKQGSFITFGLGPRMCIGQHFAMFEAKMAMALILSRFWFELSPSYIHAPYTLVTLQPQYGAPVILHKL